MNSPSGTTLPTWARPAVGAVGAALQFTLLRKDLIVPHQRERFKAFV